MIDAMDIYARLRGEEDGEGEYSLKLAVTALDIEIKTDGGTVTLGHEDSDQITRLVTRCRAAWRRLNLETESDEIASDKTRRGDIGPAHGPVHGPTRRGSGLTGTLTPRPDGDFDPAKDP